MLQEPTFSHDDGVGKVDCMMSAVGVDEDILYSKSTALQVYMTFLVRKYLSFNKFITFYSPGCLAMN